MQIMCKACQQPIEVEFPDDLAPAGAVNGGIAKAAADTARGLLSLTVHDHCAARLESELRSKENCERMAERQAQWEQLCPPAFQDTEFKLLPDQRNSKLALDWKFNETGVGLMLHGFDSGRGKTRTAFLVLHEQFVKLGKSFMAITHVKFASSVIQLQFSEDRQAVAKWMARLKRTDILFIDDLGKSKATTSDGEGSKAEEALFELLDDRFNSRRHVIITTNFAGMDLEQKFSADRGPFIVRRLREFCFNIPFVEKARLEPPPRRV